MVCLLQNRKQELLLNWLDYFQEFRRVLLTLPPVELVAFVSWVLLNSYCYKLKIGRQNFPMSGSCLTTFPSLDWQTGVSATYCLPDASSIAQGASL